MSSNKRCHNSPNLGLRWYEMLLGNKGRSSTQAPHLRTYCRQRLWDGATSYNCLWSSAPPTILFAHQKEIDSCQIWTHEVCTSGTWVHPLRPLGQTVLEGLVNSFNTNSSKQGREGMCENDTIVGLKPTTTRLGALRSANKKHSMDLWKHMEVCFAKQMPMTLAEVEPAILVPKTNALSIRPQGGMKLLCENSRVNYFFPLFHFPPPSRGFLLLHVLLCEYRSPCETCIHIRSKHNVPWKLLCENSRVNEFFPLPPSRGFLLWKRVFCQNAAFRKSPGLT